MTWLALTGINGFIGHNLARDLLFSPNLTSRRQVPQVDFVLGLDLPGSESRATHARLNGHPRYRYSSGLDAVSAIEEQSRTFNSPPLAVIHNGACSSTTVTDPEIFRTQNVEASQALFAYCAEQRIPLLYASSASVYGDGKLGFSDRLADNDRYSPMNMYGRSKMEFDRWVLRQSHRPPTWFGMRYFNVFGPFEEHKAGQASVFYWGRQQILDSGELRLYESHTPGLQHGHQQRDFVPVQDVCRVTWGLLQLALSQPALPESGLFVNVGRGQAASWLEIGAALFEALEREPNFTFLPMPQSLREHYQNFTQADLTTLHQLGLTAPFLSLREAFTASLQAENQARENEANR